MLQMLDTLCCFVLKLRLERVRYYLRETQFYWNSGLKIEYTLSILFRNSIDGICIRLLGKMIIWCRAVLAAGM